MANISRVRCSWSGAGITGPGVSTFYCAGDQAALLAAALVNFWTTCRTAFPSSVAITVPTGGEVIDDATGTLTGVWTGGPGTTVAGNNSGAFAAGCGARIVWETGGITNGRRVRGSTYLIPIASVGYDTSGTIDSTYITAFENAGQALLDASGPDIVVWSRGNGTNGHSSTILTRRVPDRVSTLRSRRT